MDMFTALAEPNRRSILEMLASDGQLPASAISRRFHVSPPAISQHLKVLREAGLVRMEKRAQQHLYSVNTDAMHEFEEWARRMARQYEQRYGRLENILKEQEQAGDDPASRDAEQRANSGKGKRRGNGRKN